MPTAVKICGITNRDDALAAIRFGARALGFVFHHASLRNIEIATAGAIIRELPPFVAAVGLFVNPADAEVKTVLASTRLDLLQFHGEESPQLCARFGLPFLKAVRVRPGTDLLQYALGFSGAKALLLDAFVEGRHGGTGVAFDWNLIPAGLPLPLIVSGGLKPENVAAAIRRLRPYAVDVSSGVEARPGVKDHAKLAAFMQGVRDADV